MANIIVMHGDGLSSISEKISLYKKNFEPLAVSFISGKDFSFEEAVVKFSTPGLFSEKRLIILEDFDSGSKFDLAKLPADMDLTVIFKFTKQLPQNSLLLKQATQVKAQLILLKEQDDKTIFPFLDALAEKKKRESYILFEENFGLFGGQYLLTMIFYLLRRLIMKPKSLPSFILQKVERQKRNFNKEKIREIYLSALETDFRIKSGLVEERIGLTLLLDKILAI